jgi:hypothetical protein
VPSVPQATGLTTVDPKPPSFSGVPAVVQPVFSKAENLVNLPKVSLMADFVRHENRIRMASPDGRSVQIYELKHSSEQVADAERPRPGKILAVKWWKPSESSPLYLAVTAWIDQSVKSSLWKLQEGALFITRNDIPYLLGNV